MIKVLTLFIILLFQSVYIIELTAQETSETDLFEMSLEELMNTPVTLASKKAESSFDSPLSTTVITKEDIEKSGITTVEEVFRLVPGMIVRQESNGNYDIHIRGNDNIPPGNMSFTSENSMTLVMINNRKVYNYANGGTFWESLPISLVDIERIEVVRGPSTALYGPNAVSGVINIVTQKGVDKAVAVKGNVEYGNNNTGIYDFAIASSQLDNKLDIRISGNYEKRERFNNDYYSYALGRYSDYLYNYAGDIEGVTTSFYPNVEIAKERQGLNGMVAYSINDDVELSIEGGAQKSYSQNVFMETMVTPLAGRHAESKYYNFAAKVYELELQISGDNGFLNIYEGSPSAKYDYNIIDVNAEYNLELNEKLTLRPGLSYSSAVYSDLPYAGALGEAYLNDEKELSSYAYYLRGDYKATEKLRLIAALRMDTYNVPDKSNLTYQFIGTYKINENNIARVSYSKANRGAFIIDSYTNFSMDGGAVKFYGNKDLDLATMDMVELGYRIKATDNLSFDFELFHSATQDLTSFMLDSEALNTGVVAFNYENIGTKSIQNGGTVNVNWVISPKYQVRAWGTYVDAQLKDHLIKNAIDANPYTPQPELVIKTTGLVEDIKNPQTPSFYGGISLNTSPINKLNIFTDVYYLDKYTYVHEYDYYAAAKESLGMPAGSGRVDVKAKATVDIKASYQVCKKVKVFVNARNLFNNDQTEFGFADKIGGLYLAGINIDL